jgi:thiamine-phosphate diphosphorylase
MPLPRLYWITDTGTYGVDETLNRLALLLDQGLPMVQVREKRMRLPALRRCLDSILERTDSYDVKIILNGHPELAAELQLAGCHLPERLFKEGKHEISRDLITGCSLHSAEDVLRQSSGAVSYCSLSPVYTPGSKQSETRPLGPETLSRACAAAEVPVFALGGITLGRIGSVLETGCYGVAFVSELMKTGHLNKILAMVQSF